MPRKPPTPKPSPTKKSTVSRTGPSADAMAGSIADKQKAKLKAGGRHKSDYTEKGLIYHSNGALEDYSIKRSSSDAIVKPTIKKKAAAKKLSPRQR